MRQPSCFVRYWKALPRAQRAILTLRLFWLRMLHTGFRILCISFVGAILTGVGAAAVYSLCAGHGASFTQNSTSHGYAQGLFHGFAGGVTWGFTLSVSTLIYWLVIRGRRIEPEPTSHWVGGILFSGLAGLAGGFFLACMVLGVDDAQGLMSAGWLTPKFYDTRPFYNAFAITYAGFLFPIYGLFLGLGVGWSMLSLHHDPQIKWLMSDETNSEKNGDDVSQLGLDGREEGLCELRPLRGRDGARWDLGRLLIPGRAYGVRSEAVCGFRKLSGLQ